MADETRNEQVIDGERRVYVEGVLTAILDRDGTDIAPAGLRGRAMAAVEAARKRRGQS